MDRHTSLLLMTYLSGLGFGVLGALMMIFMSHDHSAFAYLSCITNHCNPLNAMVVIISVALPVGAILALFTVLLSRGLYRLFFTENKQT